MKLKIKKIMKKLRLNILFLFLFLFLFSPFLDTNQNVKAQVSGVCKIIVHLKDNPATTRTVEIPMINGSCESVCEEYRKDDLIVVDSCVAYIDVEKSAKGLVPCGNNGDNPCTICDLIVGVKNVINYGTGILISICVLIIIVAGIIYIVSAGDSGLMEKAKSALKAAIVGFAIFVCAWLIVNVIIRILAVNFSEIGITDWNTIVCN